MNHLPIPQSAVHREDGCVVLRGDDAPVTAEGPVVAGSSGRCSGRTT